LTDLFNALVGLKARLAAARDAHSALATAEGPGERKAAREALIVADLELYQALDRLDRQGGLAALILMVRRAEEKNTERGAA